MNNIKKYLKYNIFFLVVILLNISLYYIVYIITINNFDNTLKLQKIGNYIMNDNIFMQSIFCYIFDDSLYHDLNSYYPLDFTNFLLEVLQYDFINDIDMRHKAFDEIRDIYSNSFCNNVPFSENVNS